MREPDVEGNPVCLPNKLQHRELWANGALWWNDPFSLHRAGETAPPPQVPDLPMKEAVIFLGGSSLS